METDDKIKEATTDSYWRRQYVLTHSMHKDSESNMQALSRSYSVKNLQIKNAMKKLTEKNRVPKSEINELKAKVQKYKKDKKCLKKRKRK